MKILYFHQHFCTPDGSGGIRSYEFARRWAAAGHDVTVVAGRGYDDTLTPGKHEIAGFKVRCLGVRYRGNYGLPARLWAFCLFALKASLIAATARKYDIVVATSTPLTIAIPALAAKLIARRPVIFEVRDVWPDAAIDAGLLRNPLLVWCARRLEAAAYRFSNHIVPLSTGMQSRIESKGVPPRKMTMLPNCSDVDIFDPDKFDRSALRRELGADDRFIILYVGAINLSNDIPFLANAIEARKDDPGICWWIIGSGTYLPYLTDRVDRIGADNVVIWGKRPKSAVPRFVNAADVGIVSFINQPVYYENSPNKFFDYCAGGLPVVFTRTTWLQPFLEKYDAGFVCQSNTLDEFQDQLDQLRHDPQRRQTMGINARRMAAAEFPRDKIAARYLDLLKAHSVTK